MEKFQSGQITGKQMVRCGMFGVAFIPGSIALSRRGSRFHGEIAPELSPKVYSCPAALAAAPDGREVELKDGWIHRRCRKAKTLPNRNIV